MQAAKHDEARSGRIWRLLVGDAGESQTAQAVADARAHHRPDIRMSGRSAAAPGVSVHRPGPTLELLDDDAQSPPSSLERRLDRLETGVRLLAEALKGAHADLSEAVAQLRMEVDRAPSPADVLAATNEALLPLQEGVARLTEATQSLPLILGSATERLAARIDASRASLEETVIALLAAPPALAPNPRAEPGTNGDGGSHGRHAREIWGGPG